MYVNSPASLENNSPTLNNLLILVSEKLLLYYVDILPATDQTKVPSGIILTNTHHLES